MLIAGKITLSPTLSSGGLPPQLITRGSSRGVSAGYLSIRVLDLRL